MPCVKMQYMHVSYKLLSTLISNYREAKEAAQNYSSLLHIMPSLQIAACQNGRIAMGHVHCNSYSKSGLIAVLLCLTGDLVKHD